MESTNFKPLNGEGSFNYCTYSVYFGCGHIHHHHVLMQYQISEGLREIAGPDYSYVLTGYQPVYLTEAERKSAINVGLIRDGETMVRRLKEYEYKKKKEAVG